MPKFKKGIAGIMAAAMLATAIGTPAAAFAAKDKTVATITWTFAAGNAAGGISVDDSWEGNHEMGID